MENKCWFDCVSADVLSTLKSYARKQILGNVYSIDRIKGEDLFIIEYDMRNYDDDFVEYLTPFGIVNSVGLVDGYAHSLSHPATKLLFNIMCSATRGIFIDGKTYAEAFNEARGNVIKKQYAKKIDSINEEIHKLQKSKDEIQESFNKQYRELQEFVNPVLEEEKNANKLILKDILIRMSTEEQKDVLAELGLIANETASKTEERIVINNGLNDIVL